MRKCLLLVVLLAAIGACVTNPIKPDPKPTRAPVSPGTAALTGLLPGLTQLLNGEFIEAAIYATAFYAPLAVITAQQLTEGPLLYALGGSMYASLIWSYVDGIVSSAVRTNQCREIAPELLPARPDAARRAEALRLGMTQQDVLRHLGRPDRVNRSTGSWGVHEQWVYNGGRRLGDEVYVYFENGVLTSWSER